MENWFKVRKDLYLQTRTLVEQIIGESQGQIRKYEAVYQKELTKPWKKSSKTEIFKKIQSCRLLLLGDFHALRQSQKSHTRILREIKEPQQWSLGMECFFQEDQLALDDFTAGKLSEKDFLKKIQWKKHWGFPWASYKAILTWAIKNKVRVIGLNKKSLKGNNLNLNTRDMAAADLIARELNLTDERKMIVIYGDFHLAHEHLVKKVHTQLKPSTRPGYIVRVFQNPEDLYFKVLKKDQHFNVDVLSAGHDFCLLNVPPWVKWQNYLMYLDLQSDQQISDSIDYADRIAKYVEILSAELKLKIKTDRLSVYSVEDDVFFDKISNELSREQNKYVEKLIENDQSFYIPELGCGYLARKSVNHCAWLASQYLISQINPQFKLLHRPNEQFEANIWLNLLCYFGNKVINPKKKTDTVYDIKSAILNAKGFEKKEIYQIALGYKLQELLALTGRNKKMTPMSRKNLISYFMATQLLGGMLGEKLFNGYALKMVSLELIKSFFYRDFTGEAFKKAYLELIDIIEALPDSFKSKTEKL